MTDREAMKMALEALKYHTEHTYPFHLTNVAIEALQKALAQPEQEPKLSDVGADTNITRGLEPKGDGMVVLHQREWVGLTDDAIAKTQIDFDLRGLYRYTRAIEARCKELNG